MLLDPLPLLRPAAGDRVPLRRRGAYRAPGRPVDARRRRPGREFLFVRTNPKGVHAERWNHAHGCQRWFNALRDTASDRIRRTPTRWARRRPDRRGRRGRDGPGFPTSRGRPHRPRAGRSRSASTAATSTAIAGDTVASALLANGIHLVGRSFKYHRPRGILAPRLATSRTRCSTVDRGPRPGRPQQPRHRASRRVDGLARRARRTTGRRSTSTSARSTTCSRRCFVAGFYYKTFMWPRAFWEQGLRAGDPRRRRPRPRAGPRPIPTATRTATPIATCWWSAPVRPGLAAALAASESGKRVILADEQAELGGSLLHDVTSTIDGMPAQDWVAAGGRRRSTARENVALLPRTTAFGYYNHNHVGLVERVTDHLADPPADLPRERLWQVRAGRGGAGDRRARAPARLRRQ